ncbi:MAG: DUF4433 domain-containing protein [Cruoricaptor ignavus]|nr:DUF4433 domain-containing protein [Cruoricaptor ignavus]
MTHIGNIANIRQYGITHRNSVNKNPNYISIGDSSIISVRNQRLVGDKKLGDYIPFYFGKRMPMLYVIQKGFNGVSVIEPQQIIYCVTSVGEIEKSQINFLFTNGQANSFISKIYRKEDIINIENLVDFKAIQDNFWNDEEDTDKKRRKEAEFLLESDLPFARILGFVCYNDMAKQELLKYDIDEKMIAVKPNYYF